MMLQKTKRVTTLQILPCLSNALYKKVHIITVRTGFSLRSKILLNKPSSMSSKFSDCSYRLDGGLRSKQLKLKNVIFMSLLLKNFFFFLVATPLVITD